MDIPLETTGYVGFLSTHLDGYCPEVRKFAGKAVRLLDRVRIGDVTKVSFLPLCIDCEDAPEEPLSIRADLIIPASKATAVFLQGEFPKAETERAPLVLVNSDVDFIDESHPLVGATGVILSARPTYYDDGPHFRVFFPKSGRILLINAYHLEPMNDLAKRLFDKVGVHRSDSKDCPTVTGLLLSAMYNPQDQKWEYYRGPRP